MSYNIDHWTTEKIENIIVPLQAFFKHERTDWHPKPPIITNEETGEVTLQCGCEQEMKGILKNGLLTITELHMVGDGSGTFFRTAT